MPISSYQMNKISVSRHQRKLIIQMNKFKTSKNWNQDTTKIISTMSTFSHKLRPLETKIKF